MGWAGLHPSQQRPGHRTAAGTEHGGQRGAPPRPGLGHPRPRHSGNRGPGQRPKLDREAVASQARLPGKDLVPGTWQDLAVSDDGTTITVALDGVELLAVDEPLPAGFEGRLALHQGPRSQAEYASLRITGSAAAAPAGQTAPQRSWRPCCWTTGSARARKRPARSWATGHAPRRTGSPTNGRSSAAPSCSPAPLPRARLFVAASHHAQLALDGTACLSTTSFGYPGEGYYDAADVTALLAAHSPDEPKQPGIGTDILRSGRAGPGSPDRPAALVRPRPGQGRQRSRPAGPAQRGLHGRPPRGLRLRAGLDGRRSARTGRRATGTTRATPWSTWTGRPRRRLDAGQDMPPALSCGTHPVPEFPGPAPPAHLPGRDFVAPQAFLTAEPTARWWRTSARSSRPARKWTSAPASGRTDPDDPGRLHPGRGRPGGRGQNGQPEHRHVLPLHPGGGPAAVPRHRAPGLPLPGAPRRGGQPT